MSVFNSGQHVASILDRTACKKHKAPEGIPCWHVNFDTKEGYGAALCDSRIRRAGFNGQISPSSMSQKPKDHRNGARKNVPSRTANLK